MSYLFYIHEPFLIYLLLLSMNLFVEYQFLTFHLSFLHISFITLIASSSSISTGFDLLEPIIYTII